MDIDFFINELYPLQDQVLRLINRIKTGFYLTGGTALSRGYLDHRFSDDLDFFVNDEDRFLLWGDRIIQGLLHPTKWKVEVLLKEERFIRLNLNWKNINLKIELINDVPAHTGKIKLHPQLGKIDSAENILANKITAALDRSAPKDLADIYGLVCIMNLSLNDALLDAKSKAAGVFPVDLARVLCSVTKADWESVRWIKSPDAETFISRLQSLGQSLIVPA